MSVPIVIPDLPHYYPDLSGESHAVKTAHQLTFQSLQQHEAAIKILNDKIVALTAKVGTQGS